MSSRLRTDIGLAAALLLTAAVYWIGLRGGFVLDDYLFIVNNAPLHVHALDWHDLRAAMLSQSDTPVPRPLSYASFALNLYFTGLDPWWMKLVNLTVHLCNGALLFGLLRALLVNAPACARTNTGKAVSGDVLALLIATAWLLAPINLTAVLYVYQRVESAANLFVFGGLWLYVAGRNRQLSGRAGGRWRIGVGVVGCGACGLLFKEDTALLPLYAFLLEWIVFGFRNRTKGLSRGLQVFYAVFLFVPAAIGSLGILHWVLQPAAWSNRDFTLAQRLLSEPRAIVDYAWWTILPPPRGLSFYHDDFAISHGLLNPTTTLFAILTLLGAVGTGIALRKRMPLLALGIAWFLAGQVMTGTVIPLELMFEQRNYFASAGLLLALFAFIVRLPALVSQRFPAIALSCLLLCFYAAQTAVRAAEWSDPLLLAHSQVWKNPQSPRAQLQLGSLLLKRSRYRPGVPEWQQGMDALRKAAALPRADLAPEAELILASSQSRPPIQADASWWRSLDDKLRGQPINSEDLNAIKIMTGCTIRRLCVLPQDEMVAMYLAGIQGHPRNAKLLVLYASYATWVLGDFSLAQKLLAGAVALDPRNQDYRQSLKMLQASMRDNATDAGRHASPRADENSH